MMDMAKGLCYGLDPIGSHIWTLIASPISVAKLCERLTDEYAVSAKRCEKEVLNLLAGMLGSGRRQDCR